MTCLTFPEGVTEYTGSCALDGNGLSIRGEGSHSTFVVLPAGLVITYTDITRPPHIDGVTFLTRDSGAGTALKIIGPVAPSSVTRGPVLYDVAISGENWANNWWNDGIHFVDCWNPSVIGTYVRGRNLTQPPFAMGTGIKFERTQVLSIEDTHVYWAQDAVLQVGSTFGEGFSARNFNLVGVNRGIVLLQGGGYVIADGHINAYLTGMQLNGKTQISIRDNLIYKTHLSACDFVGINFSTCQMAHVTNNTIQGSMAATESGHTAGMVLGNVFNSQFIGNTCDGFKLTYGGIIVGSLSRDNQFIGNQSRNGAGNVVQINADAGPNNYLSGNKP